jgi:8-hydroxy-5-deazaflavin:NADPH oxidoreductase
MKNDMNIGVLGSGDVGRVLAAGYADRGHQVMLGSREPASEKLAAWCQGAGSKVMTGTFAEAAVFGEVIILATLWNGTENALELANHANLAGKVIVDATNPLVFEPGKPPSLALGNTDSGGEQVQRWLPEAHVVKCFNIVGNAHMVDPDFPGGPPDMFIGGDDAEAKKTVTALCAELGWPVIDLGGIEAARLLEPLCITWVLYGLRTNSWNHAFKLLRK